jgi:hypothetical protein
MVKHLLIERGKYDDEYVDYIVAILQKCKDHKLLVFIDPHQDVVGVHISSLLKCSGHDFQGDQVHLYGRYTLVDSILPILLPQRQL